MTDQIDPGMAYRILQRMGETGQPPDRGALKINVGTQEFLEVLRKEYLIPIREARCNSTFKLVQAPFGGGKTHFLHCLRETAWEEGFATSLVGVSPQACPFDDLALIYRAVARELEAPPASENVECDHGIGDVLRAGILDRRDTHGLAGVRDWLHNEIGRVKVDNHAYRRAAVLFMEAVLDEKPEPEALLEGYLRGENVSRQELQPFGIREVLEEKNAFSFLKSMTQVFHALGVPGVVLLFDEIDRVMSLTVRKRRTIADNMREMIDCCGQSSLPGLVFVYAVPPEFMTNLVPEYPALEQRLRGARRFSVLSHMNPVIDLDHLPSGSEDLLHQIGQRLLDVFRASGHRELDEELQKENVDTLATKMSEHQLESGTRRNFVKTVIQMLNEQARGEEKKLEAGDIRSLMGTEGFAQPAFDDEEVFG